MKRNIETKLKSMTKNQIYRIFIRMKGEKRKYSKNKMIYLLLKPFFQKYSMESSKLELKGNTYVKELDDYNYKYYKKLLEDPNIKDYHVPIVRLYKEGEKYYLVTENWGISLDKNKNIDMRNRGKKWAESTLKDLHSKNIFHGDLIVGQNTIHLGNVVYNEENDQFKFIDMGFDPYSYKKEHTYDKNYNKQLEKEKKMLEEYTHIDSAKKASGKAKLIKDPYNFDDDYDPF